MLARGEEGYEQARRASVWNARTPERYLDAIVLAESECDQRNRPRPGRRVVRAKAEASSYVAAPGWVPHWRPTVRSATPPSTC